MDREYQLIKSSAETVAGVGLLFTPYWGQVLTEVSMIASALAQIFGAVIGAYGVYRIFRVMKE